MDSLSAFQIPEGEYSKKVDFFDNNGCRWSFRCSTRKNDPHPKPVLSSGWIKFVKEKGLKEGDRVIVSVSDKDGAEGQQFGIQARKRVKLFGQELWSDLATTQLSIDLRLLLESPPPAINMTERLFEKTLSKTGVEYRVAIPMGSLPAFRIPGGEYSKKVDVFDNSLQLESPPSLINMTKRLFEKTLSKTDVEYRMAIPMDSLSAFEIPKGEYSKKVDVLDNNCRRWSFRCSTRKNDLHPKPVLSSGWIKFVKEKGLKEGDEVILSVSDKDGAEGLQFRIQARKSVKIFGQLLWSDPL